MRSGETLIFPLCFKRSRLTIYQGHVDSSEFSIVSFYCSIAYSLNVVRLQRKSFRLLQPSTISPMLVYSRPRHWCDCSVLRQESQVGMNLGTVCPVHNTPCWTLSSSFIGDYSLTACSISFLLTGRSCRIVLCDVKAKAIPPVSDNSPCHAGWSYSLTGLWALRQFLTRCFAAQSSLSRAV